MTTTKQWRRTRRARRPTQTDSDAALLLCARHLSAGALTDAGRAALLAQRLMHLETARAERQMKRDAKAAMERHRAEVALEQTRKVVASLNPPPAPRHDYNVLCSDKDWPETLKRMLADANAQRSVRNAEISSQPVQISPPDSC